MLVDKEELEARIHELEADPENRRATDSLNHLIALTEAYFRLALNPQMPLNDALAYLMKASRLDASNPKYAYHTARLYFLYGIFDKAARWLEKAAKLAPKNHRIWAHIALLQRELNKQYKGNQNYVADELKKLSDSILALIQLGQDNFPETKLRFVPISSNEQSTRPNSNANHENEKAGEPKASRWTGVNDISIEKALEAKATSGTLRDLKPKLIQAAQLAKRRDGGQSAFVILAIQWIICGYPVSTIQTIWQSEFNGESNTPSLRLLETVIRFYLLDIKQVASALHHALANNALSPTLAAIIHQRRLIWQYKPFRAYEAFNSQILGRIPKLVNEARDFIQAEKSRDYTQLSDDEKANFKTRADRLIRDLSANELLNCFNAEVFAPVEDNRDDELVDAVKPEELRALFARFEDQVKSVDAYKRELFDYLKKHQEPQAKNPEKAPETAANFELSTSLLETIALIASLATNLQNKVQIVIEKLGQTESPEDYNNRREALQSVIIQIGQVGNIKNSLRRIEKDLPQDRKGNAEAAPEIKTIESKLLELISFLNDALKTFDSAEKAQASSPQAIAEFFDALEKHVQDTAAMKTKAFAHLAVIKGHLATPSESEVLARDLADFERIQVIASQFEDFCTKSELALAKIQRAIEREGQEQAPEDYQGRQELLKNKLIEIRKPAPFKNRLEQVRSAFSERSLVKSESSAEILEFETGFNLALEFLRMKLETDEQVEGKTFAEDDIFSFLGPSLTLLSRKSFANAFANAYSLVSRAETVPAHLQAVQDVVNALLTAVNQGFVDAISSFDTYGETSEEPAFLYQILELRSYYAELLFRLNEREAARWHWNLIFCQDRLNASLAHSLAISDTLLGNRRDMLSSWKNYASILYMYAVAADDPSFYAQERAKFHRQYANAFAPAAFSMDTIALYQQLEKLDRHEIGEFLSNPARVGCFVDHKIAEFFNHKLNFKSPLNLLGRSRTEGRLNDEPLRKLSAFAEQALAPFDNENVKAFLQLAIKKFEEADTTCQNPELIKAEADPNYQLEEKRRIEWIASAFKLKVRIYMLITRVPKLGTHLTSMAGLEQLKRLASLPLDLSANDVTAVPNHLNQLEGQLWALEQQSELVGGAIDQLIQSILISIYKTDSKADAATRRQRERQYHRMVHYWFHEAAFAPYLSFCNQDFLGHVLTSKNEKEQLQGIISAVALYPGVTGPAIIAANHLYKSDPQKAIDLLSQAIAHCELKSFILPARKSRLQILYQAKKVAEMQDDSAYILREDDFDFENANLYELCLSILLQNSAYEEAYTILSEKRMSFDNQQVTGFLSYLLLALFNNCREKSISLRGIQTSNYPEIMVKHAETILKYLPIEHYKTLADNVVGAFGKP